MSDELLMWVEVIFDLIYLITIWSLAILMYLKRSNLSVQDKSIGKLFMWAFFLLALGDTGHVGFRVLAYGLGGLNAHPSLVGAGALATAVTVTFFYMLVAEIWRQRFNRKRDYLWWSLIMTGFIRLAIMIPSANQWGSTVPPFAWSLARNIPLMIQGIGVAMLLLVHGIRHKDRFIVKVSIMIFISYLCYTPVILYVQKLPMLGMLMIPKTLAYVVIAILAYSLFNRKKD